MNATFTATEAAKTYSALNSAGVGFAVGNDDQTLEQAAEADGMEILETHGHGDDRTLVCRSVTGATVLLGDCNGAWGVEVAHCESGQATGERCEWLGAPADLVEAEWMPVHLRASHVAAGNWGTAPHNGAMTLSCCSACAEMLADDTEE